MDDPADIIIGVVGPCKAGKTVLKKNLTKHGYGVRHIAQEHSFVQDMWKKISNPDVLIYLEVSFETTLKRSSLAWNKAEYQTQLKRLNHAKKHADLIITTDDLTPEEITNMVLDYLSSR